jgi:hypothetical protein
VSTPSFRKMASVLTLPYRRGAETQPIVLGVDAESWTWVPPYDFREFTARHGEEPESPRYVLTSRRAIERDRVEVEIEYYLEETRTVLALPLTALGDTLEVLQPADFPAATPFLIRVGRELLQVTAAAGAVWTVVRGVGGTAAVEHAVGTVVAAVEPEPPLTLRIPAHAEAGLGLVIPLPPGVGSRARLLRLREREGPAVTLAGHERWAVDALLGNIAKLSWVLGAEKDTVRRQMHQVRGQRALASARRHSLDLLGRDLRVPRFPPREHSVDPETIALYHLNDEVADGEEVAEESTRFRPSGHPGTNLGVASGATGKFGRGFRFPGSGGSGRVEVPSHVDFDVPADRGLTVEAFVRADPGAGAAMRTVLCRGPQDADGLLDGAGWLLAIGAARGFPDNLLWSISDGATRLDLFADLDLAEGKDHHVAGMLDREAERVRLFVDGRERASARAAALGAITNAEPFRMGGGPAGSEYSGVLDEVRISGIARRDFHPVLGEGDETYRARLGVFEEWMLPSPVALERTLGALVNIAGDGEPFVVLEGDRPAATVLHPVRIVPAEVPSGRSIDRDGKMRSSEAEVSGTADDDGDFRPFHLIRHNRPEVDYGAAEANRRMQAATTDALNALVDLLAEEAVAGTLRLTRSYDAEDSGLHRVGRALRLEHTDLSAAALAAYAHRAGFDTVRNEGVSVRASVAPGDRLRILNSPASTVEEIDLLVGQTGVLELAPEGLPGAGRVRWSLIPCGRGRGHLENPADPGEPRRVLTKRPPIHLVATAPGEIAVRVAFTYQGRAVTTTRRFRIGVESLEDGAGIGTDGELDPDEVAVSGEPEPAFDQLYLVEHDPLPRFGAEPDYGADPDNRRMQLVTEKRLDRLLELLGGATEIADLSVLRAFDGADAGLHGVGRALRLTHSTLPPGELAALAHTAGFDFVLREGTEAYASVAAGPRFELLRAGDLSRLGDEVTLGEEITLRPRFSTLPPTGNFHWSVVSLGQGEGSTDFLLRPEVTFAPRRSGLLGISLTYLEEAAGHTAPYSFEVRLKPSLDVPETTIPKHEYDLIMNVLNYFHPIGVEVITTNLREHVVEVRENLLNAFPGYTYPDFRT